MSKQIGQSGVDPVLALGSAFNLQNMYIVKLHRKVKEKKPEVENMQPALAVGWGSRAQIGEIL